jgi:hypothetical protein
VAIGFYEGKRNKSESVEARYPNIHLSDLIRQDLNRVTFSNNHRFVPSMTHEI